MTEQYIPYDQYYKFKNDPQRHFPEYMVWFLENREPKPTNYNQCYKQKES